MEIDLVYLWVDGNDAEWLARRAAFTGAPKEGLEGSETACKARWANNDELRYSLRSAEKFAPWIRRIFIVTDGQTPAWLDTANPRVRVIDQNDIIPTEARPCYNSAVIEYFLHRIPGISNLFIYANDDMFFGKKVGPEFFFTPDGRPIVRLTRKPLGRLRLWWKRVRGVDLGYYRRSVESAAREVRRITGRYISGVPHHNIDAYSAYDNRYATEVVFVEKVGAMIPNHMRQEGDLQRVALSYWALATGRAVMKHVVGSRESLCITADKPDYMRIYERRRPSLFCLNDNQHSSDDDRARIRPFLEALFPTPSVYEKSEKQLKTEQRKKEAQAARNARSAQDKEAAAIALQSVTA